jgi:hypothetical protein
MSNEDLSPEKLAEIEKSFMSLLQERPGVAVANKTMMDRLKLSADDYWAIRNRLVDQARVEIGRGRGGSVRSLVEVLAPAGGQPQVEATPQDQERNAHAREEQLYEPLLRSLEREWALDKRYDSIIVEQTAKQGKRETGGKWTRPDIAVASMRVLPYYPGKIFDVTTFEVKPENAVDVTAVYEALAHRRAATRSYVWFHLPSATGETLDAQTQERLDPILAEAKRHGIGVWYGVDPGDFQSWEELVEATRNEPDPQRLNDFIAVQFSVGNKDRLLRLMR